MTHLSESQIEYAAKIAKLKTKADSAEAIGNVEEAAAFAAKAQELMLRHELEMTDVEMVAAAAEDPIGVTKVLTRRWGKPGEPDIYPYGKDMYSGRRRAWYEDLTSEVARHFMCRRVSVPASTNWWVIGRASHRAGAIAVGMRLAQECIRLGNIEYAKANYPRGFMASFQRGFVAAVTKRMRETRRAEEERIKASMDLAKGTALVLRPNEALERSESWERANLKLCYNDYGVHGRRATNAGAYTLGHEAGSAASLDGGLKGKTVERLK